MGRRGGDAPSRDLRAARSARPRNRSGHERLAGRRCRRRARRYARPPLRRTAQLRLARAARGACPPGSARLRCAGRRHQQGAPLSLPPHAAPVLRGRPPPVRHHGVRRDELGRGSHRLGRGATHSARLPAGRVPCDFREHTGRSGAPRRTAGAYHRDLPRRGCRLVSSRSGHAPRGTAHVLVCGAFEAL